jgi:hypothetical protein
LHTCKSNNSALLFSGYVRAMSAAGGGDDPDAVADGLYEALNLTYRPRATKICVWIGRFIYFEGVKYK